MSKREKSPTRFLPKGLGIVYEDKDILVADKPPGLLTIGTERDRTHTAYYALTDYVRKGAAKSRNRIFIVHRLDRDTSGLLVFAKTEEAKRRLQENWDTTRKQYLTVVHGRPRRSEGLIESWLAENPKSLTVYSTTDRALGKLARTAYRVVKTAKIFSLLEVDLLTGRKHQIRVHMKELGHPVVGDKKYGRGTGDDEQSGRPGDTQKHMALHAWTLAFTHPATGAPLHFTAPVPRHFENMVGKIELPGTTADAERAQPANAKPAGSVTKFL